MCNIQLVCHSSRHESLCYFFSIALPFTRAFISKKNLFSTHGFTGKIVNVVEPRVLCSSRCGIKRKMLQPQDNINPIEADDDNEVADQDKTQNEKTDSPEDRKRVGKGRGAYESYNHSLQTFMAQRNAENAQFVEFMKDMKEQQQQKTAMLGQLINIFQKLADKN